MTWIKTIAQNEATGLLKRLYDSAIKRAGKVFKIIECQSPRPETLRSSTALYIEVMQSQRSPLSRMQRELIATVVSATNACEY